MTNPEKYELTRTGNLVARCLLRPFDTNMRKEIEHVVYRMANLNPRPIILEQQLPDLVDMLTEAVGNVEKVKEVLK